MKINGFIVLFFLPATALTSTLCTSSGNADPKSAMIAERYLREPYRGIHWEEALLTCDKEQFKILLEVTRMALEVTSYMWNIDGHYDKAAWHRRFVRNSGRSYQRGVARKLNSSRPICPFWIAY